MTPRRLLVAALAAATATLLAPAAAHATTIPPYGTVLVPGPAWAGTYASLGDLNVYSNGGTTSNAKPGPYGPMYQCTELATRWAAIRYGESVDWGGDAAQMWTNGPHMPIPFVQHPNGGPDLPQFGDILVFGATSYDPTGHVAVVSGVGPGTVSIVEQNWQNLGTATLPITGTTMPARWGLPVLGWLRSSTATPQPWTPESSGPGGYVLDGDGNLHPYGSAPNATQVTSNFGWDIARGITRIGTSYSGYVLDGFGGLHPYGGAPYVSTVNSYWPNWDIARAVAVKPDTGTSGYVLDGYGGLHPFGGATPVDVSTHYWPGWDIARSVALRADGHSGYVLDGWGGLHAFGGAPDPGDQSSHFWQGWDIARAVVLRSDGVSGYILDAFGGLHAFGGAPAIGNGPYFQNAQVARGVVLTGDSSGFVGLVTGPALAFGGTPDVTSSGMQTPDGRGIV